MFDRTAEGVMTTARDSTASEPHGRERWCPSCVDDVQALCVRVTDEGYLECAACGLTLDLDDEFVFQRLAAEVEHLNAQLGMPADPSTAQRDGDDTASQLDVAALLAPERRAKSARERRALPCPEVPRTAQRGGDHAQS
jgi:hypothetical protein